MFSIFTESHTLKSITFEKLAFQDHLQPSLKVLRLLPYIQKPLLKKPTSVQGWYYNLQAEAFFVMAQRNPRQAE